MQRTYKSQNNIEKRTKLKFFYTLKYKIQNLKASGELNIFAALEKRFLKIQNVLTKEKTGLLDFIKINSAHQNISLRKSAKLGKS